MTTVVKDIDETNNKITIWDLWDDEMVYESNLDGKKLIINNLNYFNGDITHLENIFDYHLLGDSYNIEINEKNIITIEGDVNDRTKYYNLESFVTYATYGTNSTAGVLTEDIIPVKYSDDIIYGANYNILSFLKNLNPIFTDNYEFSTEIMPDETFNYNPLVKTALGELEEFRIEKNIIYIGTDLEDQIKDFKAGTFLDITNGNKSVNRVYIKEIRTEFYDKYPTKIRYVIITDKQLGTNLNLTGDVRLRTRNKLGEISLDLEFTDDIMMPISNNGSNAVELYNSRYYNNDVTSYQYAKILMNDDNIRNNVSSVVFLDEESDWNMNVIDWKFDPNFNYRPLEILEVGVDRVFKKAISIDSSNYLIDGEILKLVNVDFNNYNYRIVDGLSLKDLEEKYYWVLNADIRNATIGEDTSGFVWYEGDWVCGTWENGVWYSGRAFEIEWVTGDVYSNTVINNSNLISTVDNDDSSNTIWFNAMWGSGNWYNGTWLNGTWNKGNKFKGIWKSGIWKSGIWEQGEFSGGVWKSGTWLDGTFNQDNSFSVWETGTWLGGDFENGTWLNGIFDQTDRVASRFGTKASLLNLAVWEYGWFKNGEFHSGLNTDSDNNAIASLNYKYSIWKNGVWEKGNFYGGQWDLGVWKNGIWHNGYWKSNNEIKEFRARHNDSLVNGVDVEVEFNSKHFYKDLIIDTSNGVNTHLQSYFYILGEPKLVHDQVQSTSGLFPSTEAYIIHPITEAFGHNTLPMRHVIKEILSDTEVLINVDISNTMDLPMPTSDDNFLENITVVSQAVECTYNSGTMMIECACKYECTDYSELIIEVPDSTTIPTLSLSYDGIPRVASHWASGNFNRGVWDYGYYSNGTWKGGVWIDGVFDSGNFGGE